MFGSNILDAAIGLALVYLLASLIVSAATELLAGWLGWRADKLLDGIRNLINSPGCEDWAQRLYNHALIQGLSPLPTKTFTIGTFRLAPLPPGPSYIPSGVFSAALLGLVQERTILVITANTLQGLLNAPLYAHTAALDIKKAILQLADNVPLSSSSLDARIQTDLRALANRLPDVDATDSATIATVLLRTFLNSFNDTYLAEIIHEIPNEKLRTSLGQLLQQSNGNLERLNEAVEAWFNDAMERVSGWYKRHTQWVQVLLGLGLTFALNLDSISIVRVLSTDSFGLLKAAVAEAQKFPSSVPSANNSSLSNALRLLDTEFTSRTLPIGWTDGRAPTAPADEFDLRRWPGWSWVDWFNTIRHHLIGWLLTVVVVSLGAPFLFGLINRFTPIRSSGPPPQQQSNSAGNITSEFMAIETPKPASQPKIESFGRVRIAISSAYIAILLIFWLLAILVVWPDAKTPELIGVPDELRYLLLVTSGGALGSALVTLLSLSSILDTRFEQRRVVHNWMWRNLLLNMLFAIPLAIGLFLFVRGFLLRTEAKLTDFNPYGLLFASVLVGMSAVTQNRPLMVENKGFKTSHSMGVKTALDGPGTAGPEGHVECPESEPANDDTQFSRSRMVSAPDCTRAWDQPGDRRPVFALS